MKKPKDTKSESAADTAADKTPATPKKDAAAPGVIGQTEIGAADGAAAVAKGAQIKPVESTLLGDGAGQNPPAARKADKTGRSEKVETAGTAPKIENSDRPEITGTAGSSDKTDHKAKAPAGKPQTAEAAKAASAPVPATVERRKSGFWPLVLGGVVAAGLGSAATIWALPNLPAAWLPEQPQPEVQPVAAAPEVDVEAIRNEAVAAAQSAAAEQIDALRAELAAQPAAATPDAPAGPSAEDLAALRQQIDSQAAQIQELTVRPQIDPDLAARVQELAGQADTLEQQLQTAAQAAQAQINAAQAEAQELQEAAAESTRRAEAVAAIAALQAALDEGVTADEARQALEGAGIEAPEALTRDVPSLDSLRSGFPDAARAALRTSLSQDSAAGNGSLFGNFLRAQTGARSVEAREGSDPDAILSRANDAVEAGRIGDAVTEIEALPEAARTAPAMADWLAGATAYRDAQAALSDLSAPSN